ncbi:glycosyltransferase family 1 protein [Pedobacter sp. G11]|uniref:glycosyltransferase family 4 protein n=1 Tax=Pedobacter sp. G11 TaxID=2482728 RepID=UPI000F5E6FD7|nr:glycosyltransferase family 4 protein [Pedobacter sp. G11]AZI25858.1 glycosyltransferase family 1 protein [Pedobacter sp. G11]
MHKKQKILFLSLYTFGFTGGIEKVCRAFLKALSEFKEDGIIGEYKCLSMYDTQDDQRYTSVEKFKGFNGKRFSFGLAFIKHSLQSNIIVLSHINLLIFGWLIKKIKPATRLILFAHGIEIWKSLNDWKKTFLKNQVEIWAVSQYTAGRIQEEHGIAADKLSVINNCLDPFFEVPKDFGKPIELLERYGLTKDRRIILTLTRLSSKEQYKGYDQVLSAISGLPEDIHYILAGKADEAEFRRVKKLLEQSELQNRVTFTGFVAEEEITQHYLLADIFVMPSTAEGFGISFIEASACGCKVIAGNLDGSTDALLNGELGTLINPKSLVELQDAINSALANPVTPKKQQGKTLENFAFSKYKQKLKQLLIH